MNTLKDAIKNGNLKDFIAEREAPPEGDLAAFDQCLTSMAGTKKPERRTSAPRQ